jgi:hypothetical protein
VDRLLHRRCEDEAAHDPNDFEVAMLHNLEISA